jgi:hypothetical protein
MKTCRTCKEEYPATPQYFFRSKYAKDSLLAQCKKCAAVQAGCNFRGFEKPVVPDGKKRCSKCKTDKSPDEFHRSQSTSTGRASRCKACCARHFSTRPPRPVSFAEYFWQRTAVAGECVEWQAARYPSGYGKVSYQGRGVYAHRVAWQLTNGPIPAGLWILHHCDNPRCVKPDHLYAGTAKDNAEDRENRGRGKSRRK